jgi:endogenous inhibitor of DNA gyrase (YacG/DUF329 family)
MNKHITEVFVRCLRVGEMSPRMLAPNTTVSQCAKCECDVYVSQSSAELIEQSEARPICSPCCELIDYIPFPHTEAQAAEFREHKRRMFNN